MSKKVVKITVSEAESGQKLLAFLQRNLKNPSTGVPLPKSLLHRLVRSGQVRVNSSRSNPFTILQTGDLVRIPPLDGINPPERNSHLPNNHENEQTASNKSEAANNGEINPKTSPYNIHASRQSQPVSLPVFNPAFSLTACLSEKHPELIVLSENDDYIVFNKPAGLPVHPGSRQPDSLISWVHACVPLGHTFLPTLAHRLDKATSGVLLVAKSYRFLRAVQDSLAGISAQVAKKEYLAWVQGAWQAQNSPSSWQLLEDWLEKKQDENGSYMEKMKSIPMQPTQHGRPGLAPSQAAHCLCRVKPIGGNKYATLMQIELLTGRTHQIRVQLASRGHPIVGDRKYNGPACKQGMLLHSYRFCLPNWPNSASPQGVSFESLPNWQGIYLVNCFIPGPQIAARL